MELVERPARRVHLVVVLPRLGDHHQDRVREAASGHVQQLHDLVEAGRVARAVGADRQDPPDVAGDHLGVELRLAGLHPVAVAAHGVDLAVVGDQPVGMGQAPAREGVGREPGVHERQRAGDPRVGEVGEERLELAGRQHALVDQGPAREAGEVDLGLALGPLAQAERHPLEHHLVGHPAPGGHEELAEARHRAPRGDTHEVRGNRHLAPAQDDEVLLLGDPVDRRHGVTLGRAVVGQEGQADRVRARRGKLELHHGAQEAVRDLEEDARPVAAVRLGARGATVVEVAQRRERLDDDVVAGHPGHGGHEGHATGVPLEGGVVQAGGGGDGGEQRHVGSSTSSPACSCRPRGRGWCGS